MIIITITYIDSPQPSVYAFEDLTIARRFSRRVLGTIFDIGSTYAINGYGDVKLEVDGTDLHTLLGVTPDNKIQLIS